MARMYKKGSDPIEVHDSQIENAIQRGWSLKKPTNKLNQKKEK